MPTIRPLRALRYGRDLLPDLDRLISPSVAGEPEDRNPVGDVLPANVRHLVRGDRGPLAADDEPPFTHAARLLSRWKEDGVLVRDPRPAFYIYEQRIDGIERRGVVTLVRLGEDRLLPHEVARGGSTGTLRDQLAATRCQLSLVFAVVPDRSGALAEYLAGKPGFHLGEVRDGDGVLNRLWRDEDPRNHVALAEALRDEPAVIADGHHRVEAALLHQTERAGGQPVTRERPYDYVMTLLVPASAPGLRSLPTHRVCEQLGPAGLAAFDQLGDRFAVEELELGDEAGFLDGDGVRFVLVRSGRVQGLTLRDTEATRRALATLPEALREVEPAVLGATVLDPVLAAEAAAGGDAEDGGGAASGSSFNHNRATAEQVAARAYAGEVAAALLVRPVPNQRVVAVAEAGERMPPKSTNFSPKPAKGLLINSLVSF